MQKLLEREPIQMGRKRAVIVFYLDVCTRFYYTSSPPLLVAGCLGL
jgi:hypothetical protein